jgi:hypothetical protein
MFVLFKDMKLNIVILFAVFNFSKAFCQISDTSNWAFHVGTNVSMCDFYYSAREDNFSLMAERQNELTLAGMGQQFDFLCFRKVKTDLYLGLGVQYMRRIQNLDESKLLDMLTYRNVYNWFSVPITLKRSFSKRENYFLFTNVGVSVSYLTNARNEYKVLGMNQTKVAELSEGLNPWLLTGLGQFGIQWNLKNNGFCGISANADFAINSMSIEANYRVRPYSFGLTFFMGLNR